MEYSYIKYLLENTAGPQQVIVYSHCIRITHLFFQVSKLSECIDDEGYLLKINVIAIKLPEMTKGARMVECSSLTFTCLFYMSYYAQTIT